MDAETAYFFRHVILRDAAYQLQMPADRAKLHALVVGIAESLYGGRPPEPLLEICKDGVLDSHPTDAMAPELAVHAANALGEEFSPGVVEMTACRRIYLHRSAILLTQMFSHAQASEAWLALAALESGTNAIEYRRRAAILRHRCGRPDLAEQLLRQAIESSRLAGCKLHEAASLAALGVVLVQSGRSTVAHEPMEAALALIPGESAPHIRGAVLNSLGVRHGNVGLGPLAVSCYRQALEIRRRIGHDLGVAATLGNLAIELTKVGDYDESERLAQEALEICRRINNPEQEGNTLAILASLCDERGRYFDSKAITETALALQLKTGNRRGEASSWSRMGVCLFHENPAEAEACFKRALALQTESQELDLAAATMNNLGNLLCYGKRWEEARACIQQGLQYARQTRNRHTEGLLLGCAANVETSLGRFAPAAALLEQALAILREISHHRGIGLHSCDLAICHVKLREFESARKYWGDGYRILEKIGDAGAMAEKNKKMAKACAEEGVQKMDA
ncbi:hypothetical protein PLCT2_01584 [Planctomycetaceae bacterium]|nr:hypothetical protein PLCT2_01584 [Planctomycetaceae bacterium]